MTTQASALRISPAELTLMNRLGELSSGSGSHSPSLVTMQRALPGIKVNVDACFLSNPLATDLFWSHFNSDLQEDPHFIKRTFEAYPSQNRVIAEGLSSAIGIDPG